MWVLRILTGPMSGQTFQLTKATTTVGRGDTNDIVINHPKISGRHLKIEISDVEVKISDLGSSNGTFLNGVQISQSAVGPEDKFALFDILMDVQYVGPQQLQNHLAHYPPAAMNPHHGGAHQQHYHGNAAMQTHPSQAGHPHLQMVDPNYSGQQNPNSQTGVNEDKEAAPKNFKEMAIHYIETVLLPGVYKLPEIMEFKIVVGLFLGAFVLFVTALSSVPLLTILKSSIEQESQNRAATIARVLARENRDSIMNGIETTVTVEMANKEPGVDRAYVISRDGAILAPSFELGKRIDIPFVHEARKLDKLAVKQVDSDTIVAVEPIAFYNSAIGAQSVNAHAVVVYNMETLAVNDSRTISLYIQTFFIASIIGSILFFFLYKLVQYPLVDINKQLDRALKDRTTDIKSAFQFPELQNLITNIISTLSRALQAGDDSDGGFGFSGGAPADRTQEAISLIDLNSNPAMAIDGTNKTIIHANPSFYETTGLNSHDIINQGLDSIADNSLKLNLEDLVEQAISSIGQPAMSQLDFGGTPHTLTGHAIAGSDGPAYVLIIITSSSGGFGF